MEVEVMTKMMKVVVEPYLHLLNLEDVEGEREDFVEEGLEESLHLQHPIQPLPQHSPRLLQHPHGRGQHPEPELAPVTPFKQLQVVDSLLEHGGGLIVPGSEAWREGVHGEHSEEGRVWVDVVLWLCAGHDLGWLFVFYSMLCCVSVPGTILVGCLSWMPLAARSCRTGCTFTQDFTLPSSH